jgi:hypothetical protein
MCAVIRDINFFPATWCCRIHTSLPAMGKQDSSQPNDKMNDEKPPKKNQNQKNVSSGLYTSQDLKSSKD